MVTGLPFSKTILSSNRFSCVAPAAAEVIAAGLGQLGRWLAGVQMTTRIQATTTRIIIDPNRLPNFWYPIAAKKMATPARTMRMVRNIPALKSTLELAEMPDQFVATNQTTATTAILTTIHQATPVAFQVGLPFRAGNWFGFLLLA
jgi:hypothetical protein